MDYHLKEYQNFFIGRLRRDNLNVAKKILKTSPPPFPPPSEGEGQGGGAKGTRGEVL
jgi:hypothetical protein